MYVNVFLLTDNDALVQSLEIKTFSYSLRRLVIKFKPQEDRPANLC